MMEKNKGPSKSRPSYTEYEAILLSFPVRRRWARINLINSTPVFIQGQEGPWATYLPALCAERDGTRENCTAAKPSGSMGADVGNCFSV